MSSVTILLMLTAFVAGLARGFSGFGAALIFVPVAAALTAPAFAAPVLLVIDGIMTLPMVRPAWKLADRSEVFTMAIGSIAAVPLGAWALSVVDPVVLRWAICALAVMMLGLIISGWRCRGEPHPAGMIAVGAVSGVFSGAAQIGGPPVVAWFTGRDNAPPRLRANIILFFAIGSVLTLCSYLWRGLFSPDVLLAALFAAPAYGLGLWLGARAFGHASPVVFRRICLMLIGAAIVIGLPLWQA